MLLGGGRPNTRSRRRADGGDALRALPSPNSTPVDQRAILDSAIRRSRSPTGGDVDMDMEEDDAGHFVSPAPHHHQHPPHTGATTIPSTQVATLEREPSPAHQPALQPTHTHVHPQAATPP